MKTQKFFMALAAIAALSLGSCTQEEELLVSGNTYDSLNDPNAVLFGTYLGQAPQSRGAEMNLDALKTSGFGVYAYYTGTNDFVTKGGNDSVPNFMCNQQVTWASDAWTYTPVKYWPSNADEKVSFFAYAPYTTVAKANAADYGITSLPDNTTKGDPKIGYTLSENPAEQIDLLYADDVPNYIKQDVGQKVQFNFNHAMSRIGFKRVIEVDEINQDKNNLYDNPENDPKIALAEGTTVTITKVSLSSKEFNKFGELNLQTGEWENLNKGRQSYTLTESDFGAGKTADKTTSKTPTQLNNNDKYLMIFPTNGEIPIEITVAFNVTTEDPKLPGGKSQITSEITTSFNFEFDKGKFYNFVLHIGLTSVKLDALMTDWDHQWRDNADSEDAEVVVNTPYNEAVSLIYDANEGKFRNGSSQYIITSYVGNFDVNEDGNESHNPQTEAKFIIRDFKNDNSDDDEISYVKNGTNFTLSGWTIRKTSQDTQDEVYVSGDTVYGAKGDVDPEIPHSNVIFVEKTDTKASGIIYAWWPKAEGH